MARNQASTNRNLYFLSIVTAVFLSLTLITGVFGMNVGGLPGPRKRAWLLLEDGADDR